MDPCYGHHFNNQTKKIWRKMATSRTAMSRSLKFSDRELPPVTDAGICRSNACMFDVSVASLSAMSRCCRISGSSSWWSVALSQTPLGSCVRACSRSSSKKHHDTHTSASKYSKISMLTRTVLKQDKCSKQKSLNGTVSPTMTVVQFPLPQISKAKGLHCQRTVNKYT